MDTQILEIIGNELGLNATMTVVVLTVLGIWQIVWKGLALWKSARLNHKWWFIPLLLINTLGLLEIIYIFFVARKKK